MTADCWLPQGGTSFLLLRSEDDGGCLEAGGRTLLWVWVKDGSIRMSRWLARLVSTAVDVIRASSFPHIPTQIRAVCTDSGWPSWEEVDFTADVLLQKSKHRECVSPSGNTASHTMVLQRCVACDIWNCSPHFFTADHVGISLQSLLILQLCLLDISFKSSAGFFWHWIEQSTLHSSKLSGRGTILPSS